MLQQHCTFVIRLPGNPLMEHCKQLTILMKNVKNHFDGKSDLSNSFDATQVPNGQPANHFVTS